MLIDLDKGLVIEDQLAAQKWYPASLTKLMTTYVIFRALAAGEMTLESPVRITANALAEPPSKMGFPVGTQMTVDNALKMLLVKSANDIAVALAEAVGGSEARFIARMNDEAARLGMTNTHYANPNGLHSDAQITSARDLALLARPIWPISAIPKLFGSAIRSGKRVLRTYNPLLERYQGATGMKTGFICNSGFNLVASATRGGRSMLVVVLGAYSATRRAETAARLLDKGFQSWGVGRVGVDAYLGTAETYEPVNLRLEVCGRRKRHEAEEIAEGDTPTSPLGPRVSIMEPVRVVTMTGKPAAVGAAIPAKAVTGGMPVPRPRRQESADTALIQAYSPNLKAPSADAIGDAIRSAPASLP
jgi:D-alanyl-D-alanine carboxypeptidase